jgi:hypothetical protein
MDGEKCRERLWLTRPCGRRIGEKCEEDGVGGQCVWEGLIEREGNWLTSSLLTFFKRKSLLFILDLLDN